MWAAVTMSRDPQTVVDELARRLEIPSSDLTDPTDRRHQPLAYQRQLAMYLVRELCDLSLPETGRVFGRHHTTVLHAVRVVGRELRNPESTTYRLVRRVEVAVEALEGEGAGV